MLQILSRTGPVGIMPDDIDITGRRCRRALVKVVSSGIPDEACPDPAIRPVQGAHRFQEVPTEWIDT